MKLCFATNNHHKLEEVMSVLGNAFHLVTLREIGCEDELPETQDTIMGNAEEKAEYVWNKYRIPCFADDTGLEVEALGGAPGVHSAHYAGNQRNAEANMRLLLKNLEGIENRRAQFRTIICLITSQGKRIFEGILKGAILEEPRGNHGFGYDPLFLPEGSARTLAEMTLVEKNNMSHRSMAVNKLSEFLRRM